MRLNPPTKNVFWVAVALGVLGFLGQMVAIPVVSAYGFWFMTAAFVLLVVGNTMKGL